MIVVQHVRPKYACEACQANVVIAERLPEPIEKGLPGPGLLAHVAVSKYADHLPLYRQEGIFKRFGVELSRSTMCDWMAAVAEPARADRPGDAPASAPVGGGPDRRHDGARCRTRRQGDQDRPALGPRRRRRPTASLVYDYTPDSVRRGTGADASRAIEGYLQADAYSAYDRLFADGTIIEVGCWMHARRKFHEARTSDPERSHIALAYIKQLYKVEDKGEALDDAGRVALRQAESAPILETFEAWLRGPHPGLLPKSPLGEAIGYALNHWVALKRYLEAGFLRMDNNAVENGERPVALGRNYADPEIMRSPDQATLLHVPPTGISVTITCGHGSA